MLYQNNAGIQGALPTNSIYFKEEAITELLSIPTQKPDMENILDILVWPEIENVNLIETMEGVSNEGQRLTGAKLVVEVRLKQKVTYVAAEETQSVHAAHYEILKSMFVIIPDRIDGRKACDLLRSGKINVTPYIESVHFDMLDPRTIHKCVLLFLDVTIS